MLEGNRDSCGSVWVAGDLDSPAASLSAAQSSKVFLSPRWVHKLTEKERHPAGPNVMPCLSQRNATGESSKEHNIRDSLERWGSSCLVHTSMEQ